MDLGDNLEHIRSAAEILATDDTLLKERLKKAGSEFWSGTFGYEEWSQPLQEQADEIIGLILQKGTVQRTVEQMDRETAREASRLILQFMVDFELFKRESEKARSRTTGRKSP